MNEARIRRIVASHLVTIDPQLTLVGEEHTVTLSGGEVAKIDILAKDKFGCFSVIKIKKSDQTARSTVQQLYKYAHFLKVKYRLRVSQIRCIAASTNWKELLAPFSEFKRFSEYDSLGFKLTIESSDSYSATLIDAPFEFGGSDAIKNFIFFEFREAQDRDVTFDNFIALLKTSVLSLNSVVVKLDATSSKLPNPFGFSWTIFRAEQSALDIDLVKWNARKGLASGHTPWDLEQYQLDDRECLLRTLILEKAPILSESKGEYSCMALHSLTNTIRQWDTRETKMLGPMFDSGMFSEEDAINLACGFLGSHPYIFEAHTATDRVGHFNYIRDRLEAFLSFNSRWRFATSTILASVAEGSEVYIRIYNPLNLCGMLVDLYRTGKTDRIPRFTILETQGDGVVVEYCGSVIWRGAISPTSLKKALARAYPESYEQYSLIRSVNQWLNKCDEKLFDIYGIDHEAFRINGTKLEWLNSDREPTRWESSRKDLTSLNGFFKGHDHLVEQAGKWFGQRTVYVEH